MEFEQDQTQEALFCEKQTPSTKKAYQAAIRLLTRKDYSKHKLKSKLIEKGYDEIIVDELIQELVEKKFLREDYYAEARIKGLMNKGYSAYFIKSKLEQEEVYVSTDAIFEIYNEYNYSEEQQIKELIRKKLPRSANQTPLEFKDKVRILRFLSSKGHNVQNIDQYLPMHS